MLARIIIESSSDIDKIRDDVLLLLTPLPCDWKTLAIALVVKDFILNLKGSEEANLKELVEYHFSQHQKNTAVAKIVMALQNISKSDHDSQTRQSLEAMAKEIHSKHSKFACLSQ